nr:hypothetical protein [Caulerpa lentillifera]
MNTNRNQRFKLLFDTLDWTQTQKDIIFGTLLGDASLQTQNKGRTHRYKFLQSNIHKEYFHHVISQLKPWMHKNSHFNIERKVWENETLAHSKWNFWNHLFYETKKNGLRKKQIPKNQDLELYLTPRAIAYWFMDDGGLLASNSKAIVFYTQAFTTQEVRRLGEFLYHKYSLETWVKFNKQKPVLGISGKSFEITKELIGKFIQPCMQLKFPTNRIRRS